MRKRAAFIFQQVPAPDSRTPQYPTPTHVLGGILRRGFVFGWGSEAQSSGFGIVGSLCGAHSRVPL